MKILFDNIIFSKAKNGGISNYWYELSKHLLNQNEFKQRLHFTVSKASMDIATSRVHNRQLFNRNRWRRRCPLQPSILDPSPEQTTKTQDLQLLLVPDHLQPHRLPSGIWLRH